MSRPSDSIEGKHVLGVTPTSTATADAERADKKMGGEEHELPGRDGATIQMTESGEMRTYRTYKRRWFGLAQLMLLNIVVSWDVSQKHHPTIHISPFSAETIFNREGKKKKKKNERTNEKQSPLKWLTFAPVAESAATYYGVTQTAINWLSIAFMLAFPVIAPVTIKILHLGPRPSIMASAALVLAGNWIRYAGSYKVEPSGGQLRRRHVRPDPHGSGAAVRARRAHEVFGYVVHDEGESGGYGGYELGESVGGGAGAVDCA